MKSTEYIANMEKKLKAGQKLTDREISRFRKLTLALESANFYNFCKAITEFDFPWFQKLIINEAEKMYIDGSGRLVVQVCQQHGKALSVNDSIKTKEGWKKNGDLKVGDIIDSGTGSLTKVTAVYPQGKIPLYTVIFEDGRQCKASAEHLWEIQSTRFKQGKLISKILTTSQIIELKKKVRYKGSLYVPRYKSVCGETKSLPINPYLLGVLLGDGCIKNKVCFTSKDVYIADKCRDIVKPLEMELSYNGKLEYNIKNIKRKRAGSRGRTAYTTGINGIKENLIKLNLMGCGSYSKFIPEEYLNASESQRIELLKGLMDTDGYISKKGKANVEYCTISPRLSIDFQKLVRSLGGLCSITKKKTTHQDAYRCNVRFSDQTILFSLPRKLKRCSKIHRRSDANKRLRIKDIYYYGEEEALCIKVDNARCLYTTNDYIVTHNSFLLGTLYPLYILGKHPDWKILYLTYSDSRAKEISADLLEHLLNPKYQQMFPNFKLKDELTEEVRAAKKRRNKLTISNFTNANSSRGEWKAVGIEGSYNGYSANLIIVDDYFAGMHEAMSDTINNTRWLCFTRNILTRQQRDTIIIVIGTQWREDDILGKMGDYLKNRPVGSLDWKHIILNARKDEREYYYDKREMGQYLWPEFKLNFYLEYEALDPIGWAITAMNKPESLRLKMFGAQSFRTYDVVPDSSKMLVIISCDPNYSKVAKKGDDSALTVWGIQDSKAYLLDFWNQSKVSHRETMAQINNFKKKYPNYFSVLIEDKAAGEALCQLFEESGEYKVERFISQENKRTRAQFMLPYTEGGAVYLPSKAIDPTIELFMAQFFNFTGNDGGFKDDLVDSSTQVFMHYNHLLNPITLKKACYSIKDNYSSGGQINRLLRRGKVYGA